MIKTLLLSFSFLLLTACATPSQVAPTPVKAVSAQQKPAPETDAGRTEICKQVDDRAGQISVILQQKLNDSFGSGFEVLYKVEVCKQLARPTIGMGLVALVIVKDGKIDGEIEDALSFVFGETNKWELEDVKTIYQIRYNQEHFEKKGEKTL